MQRDCNWNYGKSIETCNWNYIESVYQIISKLYQIETAIEIIWNLFNKMAIGKLYKLYKIFSFLSCCEIQNYGWIIRLMSLTNDRNSHLSPLIAKIINNIRALFAFIDFRWSIIGCNYQEHLRALKQHWLVASVGAVRYFPFSIVAVLISRY